MGFHNTAQQGIVLAEGLNPQPSPQNFRVPLPSVKGGQQGWIPCFHIPIIHLGYPPPPQKFWISMVSNFSWDLQSSQENFKTVLMQFFWGGGGGGGNKVYDG